MVREPPSSEKEKAENDWRRGASAFRLRPMSDLPQPEVIITHESDLDGFVSGHLLQRLAHTLFNKKPPLQAWNYNNWERRPLREKCAWVCDLNFAARLVDRLAARLLASARRILSMASLKYPSSESFDKPCCSAVSLRVPSSW